MDGIPAPRAAFALFCVALLSYGYFVYRGPHHNPDSRLALTYSVVERGALDIDPYAETTLDRAYVGGHYYTDKAPGLSFWLVPLFALLRAVAHSPAAQALLYDNGDRFLLRYLLTYFGVGVPAAAFAAALFTWLERFQPRAGPRLAVAAGYALGSPAYVFAVSAFGHAPAGMCLFAAFRLLWPEAGKSRSRLALTGAGLLLGAAITFEYPAAVGAAALGAYALWPAGRFAGDRQRRAPWLLLGAAPALLGLLAYQWIAFGAPWSVGYAHLAPGASYAAGQAQGVLGVRWPSPFVAWQLIAGLHRGLLVCAPWLTLAVAGAALLARCRAHRPEALAAIAVFAGLLAVNSGYVFWDGGASWGPRHLVPALPFLALLALPAAARWPRTAWLLVAGSVALTGAAVATRSLVDSEVPIPLVDTFLPAVLAGQVTNNWGLLLGLAAWRSVVPLLAAGVIIAAWLTGFRRSFGWLAASLWVLAAAALLSRRYLDYAEGYYFYLGSRVAAGARLYAETATTQPPATALLVAALWRIAPDVYLPRLAALGCALLAAVLAGRLARALTASQTVAALATLLATLLPLGGGTPFILDANALLAPLAPALALLWLRATGPDHVEGRARPLVWAAAAGLLSSVGLAIKLTFLPFVLAPLAAAALSFGLGRGQVPRRPHPALLAYCGALALATMAQCAGWAVFAGPPAADGLLGELESPLLPAGAALAVWQLAQLEGLPCLLAAVGVWWCWRTCAGPRRSVATGFALAGASLPLLAVHQGTFVGVARPAEPLIAAFAACGSLALSRSLTAPERSPLRRWLPLHRLALPFLSAVAFAGPAWFSAHALFASRTVDPAPTLRWIEASSPAGGDVLVPPYYAALAGRRMLFDYPDWTVWGMRAAAGRPRERDLATAAASALEAHAIPSPAADFRLAYIPGLPEALDRGYRSLGADGDEPARSVTYFAPRE